MYLRRGSWNLEGSSAGKTKMLAGVYSGEAAEDTGSGRTVVVGVKLDSQSKELLSWALMEVAQPGDCVIALHVLGHKEIVGRDGESSHLSLVEAFGSFIDAYEGFCNLKQVDLKFKICRGSSTRKILVREVKSNVGSKVIVGTSRSHYAIRSSAAVAKYCAKKLPKDCSVLAVNNGKVVFQREASTVATTVVSQEKSKHWLNGFFSRIHPSKKSKAIDHGKANEEPSAICDPTSTCQGLVPAPVNGGRDCTASDPNQNLSICAPESATPENSRSQSTEGSSGDSDEDDSLAMEPVLNLVASSSSLSLLIGEFPGLRLPDWKAPTRSSLRQFPKVYWAVRLPITDFQSPAGLDSESGAIVLVETENACAPPSPGHSSTKLPKEFEGLHEMYSAMCRIFKYEELRLATSNFMPDNLIGKGGSSLVYRGCLPDGKELAVKHLKQSEDISKEFLSEIEIISSFQHKNIISLPGFSFENDNLILVYDFLPRGTLEQNLHGDKKDLLALGWSERYKVAVGVAKALECLHSGNGQGVIHRDVKSSNILLADDFEPLLSDFGLATWASTASSDMKCTDVAGTFGYMAPEYFMHGKVTEKIDVFAFGVVLLELLSGRKPISNDCPEGQGSLVIWAKPILDGGKVSQLLDPRLGSDYDSDQTERMALAATLCIRRAPRDRPQMTLVLKLLQGDVEATKWARLQVDASEASDAPDDETLTPPSNLQSLLDLALLDVEEDSLSMSGVEESVSVEDYLQGRWSRSSSFD